MEKLLTDRRVRFLVQRRLSRFSFVILFANADPFVAVTFFTLHFATPLKFTWALFHAMLLHQIVSAATAHWRTASDAGCVSIAFASSRSMDIRLWITIAKCWRTLIVKQRIFRSFIAKTQRCLSIENFSWRTNCISTSLFTITIWWQYQCFTISHVRLIHQDCVTKHVLQHFANYSKFGRRFPTRFQLTTAWHTVTLAPNLHIVCHCLQEIAINGAWEINSNSKFKSKIKWNRIGRWFLPFVRHDYCAN